MNILSRLIFAIATSAALAGCAGTNFKRPDPQALTVGTSTSSDVTKVMGAPMQVGELLKNDQKLKTTRYAYAATGGVSLYPEVVPARAMFFSTFNDVLVSQEFISSFKEDATEFDESKIKEIQKGKTTRVEVLTLIGKPTGEAIYPIIKNANDTALVYNYSHVRGSVFNMKFYAKALIVSFDKNGVVTDVEYTSSGEK